VGRDRRDVTNFFDRLSLNQNALVRDYLSAPRVKQLSRFDQH
jgi:hypothetical protein